MTLYHILCVLARPLPLLVSTLFTVGQRPLGLCLPILALLPQTQASQGLLQATVAGAAGRSNMAADAFRRHLR